MQLDAEAMASALRLLCQPDGVVEVRVLGAEHPDYRWPHVESGYFDFAHLADVPQALVGITRAMGVYVTMNPVNPALQARSANHMRPARRGESTGAADIVARRWFLVDVDPARPSGICATDAEKELACVKATDIREHLTSMGWPPPVRMDSGNGYYLLYRVDLPADDGGLLRRCIQALQPMADDTVHIDNSVWNASRICRLAGTMNCKGDNLPERPHRLSRILEAPESLQVVPVALLEALAATLEAHTRTPPPGPAASTATEISQPAAPGDAQSGANRPGDDFNSRGDIGPILEHHGWQHLGDSGDNQLWRRPGKSEGNHSATFDGQVFYVFSSNAAPFEANKGYAKFQVFAVLEHDGDFSAAARELAEQGYGEEQPGEDPDVDLSGIMAAMTAGDDQQRAAAPQDPGPLPDELLEVPGFIGQVMAYTLAAAPYPNRVLAFSGALCLQSYFAARRVRDSSNLRSNIYVIALANSGVGKDDPRQTNSDIAYRAGALQGVGDAFASGEGIEDAMLANQAMLFQTDEIDAIITSVNRAKDARSEMIMQILLKLYSSSPSRYVTRKKAGQTEPLVILQPSLTLFGTAVPQYFYKALCGRMLNNGLLARMLVLDAGPRSRGRMRVVTPVPQDIIDTATWWVRSSPGGDHTGNLSDLDPDPLVVPDTPEAAARSAEIQALADDAYEEAQRQGDETKMAIWARAFEKTRKLALLYACSENHQNPQITVAGIEWAWRVVEHQTRRMLYMADLYVADNEFEGDCKRFIEILTKWRAQRRDAFMAHWDLSRRLCWPEKKIQEVCQSLMAQELIEVQMPQRGPARPQYRLKV